jgi:hypothetical protein
MNVVTQSFGEQSQAVIDWAATTAKVVGRSEFQLRQMAGTMGGILVPMMGGDRKAGAEMSTTLAELAVDLGSFFNIADDQALDRLRSGMVGETEAVELLGISLKQASLEEFARTKGITKSITKMSESEKVALRYQKILSDTADKQGDSARTAGSYANQMKRMEAQLHDLSIAAGGTILRPFTAIVEVFTEFSKGMIDVVKNSHIFEAALITLAALLTPFLIAFTLANLPIITFAAGLVAVALAIDDIWVAYEGGKSVIGDVMTALLGEDKWKEVHAFWKSSTEALGNLIYDMLHGVENAWDRFIDKLVLGGWMGSGDDLLKGVKVVRPDVKAPLLPPVMPAASGGLGNTGILPALMANLMGDGLLEGVKVAGARAAAAPSHFSALTPPLQGIAPEGIAAIPQERQVSSLVINVNGNPDQDTLRRVERTARRIQDEQNRKVRAGTSRKRKAAAKP